MTCVSRRRSRGVCDVPLGPCYVSRDVHVRPTSAQAAARKQSDADQRPVTGPAGSAMECVKCHTPLPDGSKFCLACGADVTGGGTLGATASGTEALMQRLQRLVEGKYKIERLLGKGGMGA